MILEEILLVIYSISLPAGLSNEEAALIDPLSEVGIIGDDPIGLLQLSKLRGAKNYNSWKISARIKKAKSIEQTT